MAHFLIGRHRDRRIEYRLKPGTQTVGRSTENDLQLISHTVSRTHATLVLDGDVLRVEDLGSLNGTRINGKRIDGVHAAQAGDLIEFGDVLFRLSDPDAMSLGSLTADDDVTASLQLAREDSGRDAVKLVATDERLLTLIIEAARLGLDPRDRQPLFERVVDLVDRAIPAERVLLLQKNDSDGLLTQQVARIGGRPETAPIRLSHRMMTQVVDHGTSILTGGNDSASSSSSGSFRDRCAMAAPLVHNSRVLGALYVDTSDLGVKYTDRDLHVLSLLGEMLGSKIANAELLDRERERERLEAELSLAASIQKNLLPSALPDCPGYDLCGTQYTCEAVGGDLYDAACAGNGRCQVVLGDVSGKGLGAALLMAHAMGAIRVLRDMDVSLEELVGRLHRDILASTRDDHFLTLFLAELDPESRTIEYINAGHPAAFIVSARGDLTPLAATGFPVGMDLQRKSGNFRKRVAALPEGWALVAYSDGVTEARRGEDFFGEERLKRVLKRCAGLTASEIIDRVLAAVDAFTRDEIPSDDVTLFVARRAG